MKRITLSWLLILCTVAAVAQPASDYYKSADGKKQSNLKAELNVIISDHKTISYNGLWEAYAITDVIGTTTQIFDYYSDVVRYVSDGSANVSGLNREHVCPQSWWGGGTNIAVGSDLYQVLPSDGEANGKKSNYPLGKVTGEVTYSNNRIKVGKDAGTCAILPEVSGEAQCDVSLHGIHALVLQVVCPQLIDKTNATPLLAKIEQHSPALFLYTTESLGKLFTAITAQRPEGIACKTL